MRRGFKLVGVVTPHESLGRGTAGGVNKWCLQPAVRVVVVVTPVVSRCRGNHSSSST